MNVTIRFLAKIQVSILMFLLFSCSSDREKTLPDTLYFPIEAGSVSEFGVERTTYSTMQSPALRQFTTRHTIVDSFSNIDGNPVYKIDYASKVRENEWKQDSASILWRTIDKTCVQENGQTVVKILFPLSEGMVWNGNDYNTLPEAIFRCADKGKPSQIGQVLYPKTVKIIRQDDSTLLSRNKYIEIYAPEIGLISTEKVFVKYCNTPDCIGKGIINSGYKEISVLKTLTKK